MFSASQKESKLVSLSSLSIFRSIKDVSGFLVKEDPRSIIHDELKFITKIIKKENFTSRVNSKIIINYVLIVNRSDRIGFSGVKCKVNILI